MDLKYIVFQFCYVTLTVLATAGGDLITQCTHVQLIDCQNSYKPEGDEAVCCSDFKVYDNLCFFAQQKCREPSLVILYPGKCLSTTLPPISNNTAAPSSNVTLIPPTADPHNIIYAVFCANRDVFQCPVDLDPVCATDGKFYQNTCEFAKARCVHHSLHLQNLEICKTSARIKRRLGLV